MRKCKVFCRIFDKPRGQIDLFSKKLEFVTCLPDNCGIGTILCLNGAKKTYLRVEAIDSFNLVGSYVDVEVVEAVNLDANPIIVNGVVKSYESNGRNVNIKTFWEENTMAMNTNTSKVICGTSTFGIMFNNKVRELTNGINEKTPQANTCPAKLESTPISAIESGDIINIKGKPVFVIEKTFASMRVAEANGTMHDFLLVNKEDSPLDIFDFTSSKISTETTVEKYYNTAAKLMEVAKTDKTALKQMLSNPKYSEYKNVIAEILGEDATELSPEIVKAATALTALKTLLK